jgi:hypothetical protein
MGVCLPVIALSADEVVWGLLRAGFEIRDRSDGLIVLGKGWRVVEVRAALALVPAELFATLRQAGISYSDFLEHLVDAPSEPDIDRASHVRRRRARGSSAAAVSRTTAAAARRARRRR